jgi:hypothetical protein
MLDIAALLSLATTYTDNQGIGSWILQPVTGDVLLLCHAVRVDCSGRLESALAQTVPVPTNKDVRYLIMNRDEHYTKTVTRSGVFTKMNS